jgi:hypothetical protein
VKQKQFWSGRTRLSIPDVEQCVLDGAKQALGLAGKMNSLEFSRPAFDAFGRGETPTAVMRANWTPPFGRASSNCDVFMYEQRQGTLVEITVEGVGGGGQNAKKMAKRVVEHLHEADPAARG